MVSVSEDAIVLGKDLNWVRKEGGISFEARTTILRWGELEEARKRCCELAEVVANNVEARHRLALDLEEKMGELELLSTNIR